MPATRLGALMPASYLANRSALVTGASRGIGLAVARELAAAGVRVIMVARGVSALRAVADPLGATALTADVSQVAEVENLANRVLATWGDGPDILVNAAGSFVLTPFSDTSAEQLDAQFAANLRGPFLVTRAFLPGMLRRGAGHIVNIGSVAGRIPLAGNSAYSASKYGLRGMHEVLAAELTGTGVRTTLLDPAATDTPLWDSFDLERRNDLPARSDMLQPEDVARCVRFVLDQPPGVEVSSLAVRANVRKR